MHPQKAVRAIVYALVVAALTYAAYDYLLEHELIFAEDRLGFAIVIGAITFMCAMLWWLSALMLAVLLLAFGIPWYTGYVDSQGKLYGAIEFWKGIAVTLPLTLPFLGWLLQRALSLKKKVASAA